MIPRLKPALGLDELIAALSGPRGDDLREFEVAFAELAGQKHAIAFPYGRSALVAILQALEIRDAEIICPSYTCVVVPHAIVTSGNHPVFVDPDPGDFNMDLNLVESAISTRTRAIIATSLFGYPVNLDLLDAIRERHPEIRVIQDCAHSFFCQWQGRPVQREGLCAFYGLNISKIMTSIFGGIVTTDDPEFAARLLRLRSTVFRPAGIVKSLRRLAYLLAVYVAFTRPVYALVNALERQGWLDRFVKYYDPGKIDMPNDYLAELSPVEARVGSIQCRRYADIVSHRRRIAKIYDGLLGREPAIELPPWDDGATYSHYVVRSEAAVAIRKLLLAKGIQVGELIDYYIPSMPAYRASRRLGTGEAQSLPERVINLPVHCGISAGDARNISRVLKNLDA